MTYILTSTPYPIIGLGYIVLVIVVVVVIIVVVRRVNQRVRTREEHEEKIISTLEQQEKERQQQTMEQQGKTSNSHNFYCTNCGAKILDGQNFCRICGTPVAKTSGNEAQNTKDK